MKTEALDISVQPNSKQHLLGVNLSLDKLMRLFKLTGTLARPSVTVDLTNTLLSVGQTIGGGLLYGPIGGALALLGGTGYTDHPCVHALEDLESEAVKKAGAPEEKGIIGGAKKGAESVKDAVEGVGKQLLRLLQ